MLFDLYLALTRRAEPLLGWWLRQRAAAGKELPERLPERMGVPGRKRPRGRLVWLHGASVGESVSVLPLIDHILASDPACHVMITTGTVTSAKIMAQRLPERAFHQFVPLDQPGWVERFLDHWRPDLALWIESELWPNLLAGIAKRKIPAALINGRLSERSARGWGRAPALARRMLGSFRLILAQSAGDAERLGRFADPARIAAPGNLKFAGPPLPVDPQAEAALRAAIGGRPCWLLASSHPGEEAMAAEAHQRLRDLFPGLLTIIVPRHPERGPQIAAELGAGVAVRSAGALPAAGDEIYLGDTLGELGLFYRIAPLAVMGGSLVAHGGQNPIEPAKLGRAVLAGPHMENFRAVAAALEEAGALRRFAKHGLGSAVGALLADPPARAALATAAARAAEAEAGVLARVTAALDPLLTARPVSRHEKP